MARYIDAIEDYQDISFNEYLKEYTNKLQEIIQSQEFKNGTLKDYVDVFA